MNVRELVERLEEIEDKDLKVYVAYGTSGCCNTYELTYDEADVVDLYTVSTPHGYGSKRKYTSTTCVRITVY